MDSEDRQQIKEIYPKACAGNVHAIKILDNLTTKRRQARRCPVCGEPIITRKNLINKRKFCGAICARIARYGEATSALAGVFLALALLVGSLRAETPAFRASVGLAWDHSPDPDVVNYVLYISTNSVVNPSTNTTAATNTSSTGYVTGVILGTLRTDYSGWVGVQIVVGSSSIVVNQLGRMMSPINSGIHTVKIVNASNGLDVPGAAVSVSMSGGTVGQFKYGSLSSPVTLSAGTVYWILSEELAGGDSWYNRDTKVTTTTVATNNGVAWGFGPGPWQTLIATNLAFGPVDFTYTEVGPPMTYIVTNTIPYTNAWTATNLALGQRYYLALTALNSEASESAFSNEIVVTLPSASAFLPTPPTNFVAVSVTVQTSVDQITWTTVTNLPAIQQGVKDGPIFFRSSMNITKMKATPPPIPNPGNINNAK